LLKQLFRLIPLCDVKLDENDKEVLQIVVLMALAAKVIVSLATPEFGYIVL